MAEKSKLQTFIQQWTGPAGITALVLAIVWGVQLNFIALSNSKQIATAMEKQNEIDARQLTITTSLAATTTTLDHVTDQLDRLEVRMTRNEEWIYSNRERP